MSKSKVLILTSVYTGANEKGLERVKQLQKSGGVKRDEYGRTRSWYEENDFPVPDDLLEEDEIDEDGMVSLEEDEIEYIFEPCIIMLDSFSSAIQITDTNFTTVYTNSDIMYTVAESVEDIYAQIYLLNQSWVDKVKTKLKHLFSK